MILEVGWSIYPNLEHWIWRNCRTVSAFAGRLGVSPTTITRFMKGDGETTKYVIDLILKETGMTYEKCFLEK